MKVSLAFQRKWKKNMSHVCLCYFFILYHFAQRCETWKWGWEKSYKNWLIEGWRGLKLSSAAASFVAFHISYGITLISIYAPLHIRYLYVIYIICVLKCVSGKFQLLNGLDLTAFMNIIITICFHACQPQYRKLPSQSKFRLMDDSTRVCIDVVAVDAACSCC